MEKYIIILVILATIYFIHNNLKNTEGFETTESQSVFGVNDVNSINTLAQISKKLMTGGLTVPGNMIVTRSLTVGYLPHPDWLNAYPIASGNTLNIEGPLRDISGTIITDSTKKDAAETNFTNVQLGNDGSGNLMILNGNGGHIKNAGIKANTLNCFGNISAGGTISSSSQIFAEHMFVNKDSNEGGSISIRNSSKKIAGQTNNWTIWNMTGEYGNKLAFWRYNADGFNAGPVLELFDNGECRISGNLTVDGKNILTEINQIKARLPA